MNVLYLICLVISCSSHCSVKKHEGPPLLVGDIYTDGRPDKYHDQLLMNIQRSFPVLDRSDIQECINDCLADDAADIIAVCQEFMLWKVLQKGEEVTFKRFKER